MFDREKLEKENRQQLHLTADKREIENFPQIAFGNFVYPHAVIRNAIPDKKYLELLDKKKKTV